MDDFRADVAQEMEAETVTYEQWLEYMERYRRRWLPKSLPCRSCWRRPWS